MRRDIQWKAIWLATATLALSWQSLQSLLQANEPDERKTPNIVIILADDFGYGSSNAYGAPESLVKTPNINRLAAEGKQFTHAYTGSSVCSPTRYGLITGRYSFRTSLQRGVLNAFAPLHVGKDQLTVASLLHNRGYSTAAIGKWHLGYGNAKSSDGRTDYQAKLTPGPLEIGFDYHFGVPSNHGDLTGVYVENHYVYGLRSGKIAEGDTPTSPASNDSRFQSTYSNSETEAKRLGGIELDAPRRKNDRVMDILTEKAVQWIEKQDKEKPFLLYYAPVAVHNPVTPSPETAGTSAVGIYGDWIHELDRSVGSVLGALDATGKANDTIVLFTSDNGGVFRPLNADLVQTKAYEKGLKVNGDLRGGKHTVFEGGFRVPYLVRWPGKIQANSKSDSVVSLVDTLATIASIVGEDLPKASSAAQDSVDASKAWLSEGESVEVRRDVIVHSADGVFAIRQGPWKWIEGVPAGKPYADSQVREDNFKPQLYNLADDPTESNDVSGANPEKVRELSDLLNRYREGGYSRELPSVSVAKKPGGIPAILSPLEKLPEAPWTLARGKWEIRDGDLFGSFTGRQAAALTVPISEGDITIKYEVRIGDAQRQTVRIDASEGRSYRFDASESGLSIVKNDSDGQGPDEQENWAKSEGKLERTTWIPIEIRIRGETAIFQTGSEKIEVTQGLLNQPKNTASWVIAGGTSGIRNITIE